jgi:CelD/BcsL family acetyltransferase involved in cellulose biosynthesis
MTFTPTNAIQPLRVELQPANDLQVLEAQWRSVEALTQASFFLTWAWMGCLLEALPDHMLPEVVRVHEGARLLALGLIWRHRLKRHGFVSSRSLHLNEPGIAPYNGLTMEHNGLLAVSGKEAQATEALVQHLKRLEGWDEFQLAGLTAPVHGAWAKAAGRARLGLRQHWSKSYHVVDLESLRAAGGSYLESLGSSTRYQIRRAIKSYSSRGPLKCEQPQSLEQALDWFDEMTGLHQRQWEARGLPGAFGSPFARNFHDSLMRKGWPRGAVRLTRVRAGSDVIGYLYNLCLGRTLYNYQSGHIHEADGKLKPGLVCHALEVESARHEGFSSYDMLMGGGHFKENLTNYHGEMIWSAIQQPRFAFRIESALRDCRDRWRAWRKPSVLPQGTGQGDKGAT